MQCYTRCVCVIAPFTQKSVWESREHLGISVRERIVVCVSWLFWWHQGVAVCSETVCLVLQGERVCVSLSVWEASALLKCKKSHCDKLPSRDAVCKHESFGRCTPSKLAAHSLGEDTHTIIWIETNRMSHPIWWAINLHRIKCRASRGEETQDWGGKRVWK